MTETVPRLRPAAWLFGTMYRLASNPLGLAKFPGQTPTLSKKNPMPLKRNHIPLKPAKWKKEDTYWGKQQDHVEVVV